MSEAIREFGFDCKIRKLSPKTISNYQKQLKYLQRYLQSEFSLTTVESIRSFHIKQFLAMKDDQGRKPRYINDLLKVFRTFFNYMKKEGYLMQFMKGDNSPSIRKDDLLDMEILLPSLPEQRQIESVLERILKKEQQAKETAEQIIALVDTMKKSILARAFRGELGTNDPTEEPVDIGMLSRKEQLLCAAAERN